MKYKLLRFSLLSMLVMLFGAGAYALIAPAAEATADVTYDFTGSDWTVENGVLTNGTVSFAGEGSANFKMNTGYFMMGKKDAYINFPTYQKAVSKIVVTGRSGASAATEMNVFVGENAASTATTGCTGTNTYEIASAYQATGTQYTLKVLSAHNAQITKIEIFFVDETDTRIATTMTLVDYQTTGEAGGMINLPQALVTDPEGNVLNVQVNWESSNTEVATIGETAAVINLLAPGTTTIKVSFEGSNELKPSSASYTLTVTPAAVTINSFRELQATATSTSTPATITFNGEQVVFVNGSNAFLADTNGFGALVYTNNHGLEAGQTLTGTINAKITVHQGNAEITDFSKEGLTIGTTDVAPVVKNVGEVQKMNQSTLVTLKNVTFNASADTNDKLLTDATGASIVFYDKFKTNATLEEGKAYDVTGIVMMFNDKIEICPRTADDVAEATVFRDIKADLTSTSLIPEGASPWDDVSTGIAVAEDGTLSRIAKDGAEIIFNGKWHGTLYGWANFSATVPVQGCVKITLGGSNYGSGAVTVTNAEGVEVAKIDNHINAMWSQNTPDNVAVGYYRVNTPTILNFSVCDYLPYFAVEAIAESDLPVIPTNVTLTYYDTDGTTVIGTQEVEGQSEISQFKYGASDVTVAQGKAFRGWFEKATGGKKYQTTDKAETDMSLFAVATDVEVAEAGKTFTYNLTDQYFYAEDHECIELAGNGYYWHDTQHGYAFKNGNQIKLQVAGNATISATTCAYGKGEILVKSASGETLETLAGYNDQQDGTVVSYDYEGEATTLTLEIQASGETYIHAVSIDNKTASESTEYAYRDFEIDPLGELLTAEEKQQGTDLNFGVIVAEDGTQTRVAADDPAANVVLSGTYHNDHGWRNFKAVVPVPGAVQITMSTCSWGSDVTIKDVTGQTVAEFTTQKGEGGSGCYGGNKSDDENTISAEYKGGATTLTISGGGYVNYFAIKKIEGGDEPQPHDPVVMIWDYTEAAPTANPDNGLYYGSKVNDPAGTNNGMKGIKLNSSGWAYFEKPAVAGKLTLTFGNRKNASAYEVNVSRGTLGENNKGIKGDLIGYVTINESPGSASIDLDETVTGIYIDRKSGSEGVLQKIVFKENIARTFKDFEIPYATLTADGYTGADLPEGVTFSGTFHDPQHGYSNATLVVPVDGTVKFTISGCQYANPQTFDVKNSLGETVATLDQKSAGCYDTNGNGIITYFYTDYPTTLTFSNISYLSYFKAEAAEVTEVTITYKDQNGNVLGKKTVFAGDPLGEVPYTEADLTIPEGEKFRGWVYNSGIKVKPTDIVNDNITVKASVTPIETDPTVGSIQTYDLTQATFYPEDHENFNVTDGAYYNNHGFTFAAGGSFDVKVAGKAQIVLTLCQYGNGTTISVTDAKGNVIKDDVPAKAEADGGTTTVEYDGEATTLTFTFAAQTYLHKVVVFNVEDFLAKDEQSGYYIVPAGDAASLIMALNAAASENGAKIFLPNGTYDLGETTLTSISGNNISIIGQSMEDVIVKNAPPTSMEGLGKADLFNNTSTGLYMQDLTLQNALDYYGAGSAGRAPTLHDQGTKTINKNVRHLSYQDTYYSHKIGGLYYFEGGEIHGTVDYLCGNGKVYFNEVTLVNEKRNTATIVANSELYVFNNCVVENNADKYNFGRAWSDNPVCIYLNTTLKDPEKLISTRWNLSGINCDFSKAGEYGTKNAAGEDITPESNVITFTKQSTTMNTILTAEEAATYTIQYVLGDWATEAQNQTKQVDAPTAEMKNGTISWSAADGATAYAIFKNGVLLGITTEETFTPEAITEIVSNRAESSDEYTIRAANSRGGFGEPQKITVVTGINAVNAAQENADAIYNMQGVRVQKAQKGVYIVNGRKVVVK